MHIFRTDNSEDKEKNNKAAENDNMQQATFGGFKSRLSYDHMKNPKPAGNLVEKIKMVMLVFVISIASFFSLIGIMSLLSGNVNYFSFMEKGVDDTDFSLKVPANSGDATLNAVQIIGNTKNSIAGIIVKKGDKYTFGSGFIITSDGYILTNAHLLEEGGEVTVLLNNVVRYPSRIVGTDESTDLAVLKIQAANLKNLPLGNSNNIKEGDSIMALGAVSGNEFSGLRTKGIVSTINDKIVYRDETGKRFRTIPMIQGDARINEGNTGGPLVNSEGKVIGVCTSALGEKIDGIGYSVPISNALPIINEIIANGKVSTTYISSLGICLINISPVQIDGFDLNRGIYVRALEVGGAGEAYGLKCGDIIIKADGWDIVDISDLNAILASKGSMESVDLTVSRNNQILNVSVVLK